MQSKLQQAVEVLREGGIIAYPTEGVFGLGCDPFNETAVKRLLKIKQRSVTQGLILIASNWGQVKNLIKNHAVTTIIPKNKDEPITWVFPATKTTPKWITGRFNSVAIRVTAHPQAKALCQLFKGPIVSTSANLSGNPPAKSKAEVTAMFGGTVDFIVAGKVGSLKKPTAIRDALTGKVVRD